MSDETITLSINGETVSVKPGSTVYQAAQKIKVDIPIFCYQDRMPPFGACRMCLVEVDKMPKLQTSCTLMAAEGMVVKTMSAKAVNGRKGIIELLLINHPLDCPICDKGGECPLQENAFSHGPGKSEFFEEKRHFTKPLPIGPVLMLDRERCIVCARCTRFSDLIAGDQALQLIDRGYKTEVGTGDFGLKNSKFIGNTIQICPVGALTSQVYRFRARPWDNDSANSTCTLCPVGCSMIFDSRDGEIMRTRSLENKKVNDIWLCDKGFFGYQFAASPNRLTRPLVRQNGKLVEASYEEAFSLIASKLKEAMPNKKIAAFGGNPLTCEENYLFQKLMRDVLKSNHLDHRIGVMATPLDREILAPGMEISLEDCEELSYVYLLGVDLTEEFPVIWLRLRQAMHLGAKVIFIGHFKPEIADLLAENILHEPNQELKMIAKIREKLVKSDLGGKKGALFVGRQYLENKNRAAILQELIKIKEATPFLSLNLLEGSGNSMGARLAGMRPDLLPLGKIASEPGMNALQVLLESKNSGWDFLYVAGANPAVKFPKNLFTQARDKLKFLVVQDLFLTETAELADVVLPTLAYMEKGGSFINIEGRVQKLQPGSEIPNGLYSDAEIFMAVAKKLGGTLNVDTDFQSVLNQDCIRIEIPRNKTDVLEVAGSVEEGFLSAIFSKVLFDHGVRMQQNEHLVKLAKKPVFRLNENEGKKLKVKTGDSVSVMANGNSVSGPVLIDASVADRTIVLPLGFSEIFVHNLSDQLIQGMQVKVNKSG